VLAQDYVDSLNEVRPLIELIDKASLNSNVLTANGFDAALLGPATAGAIVLLVGRFEQFLKDVGSAALDHYARAVPVVLRSQLPLKLQLRILTGNLTAAASKSRHGVSRVDRDRIRAIDQAANKAVNDRIWADDVIDTYSNPSPDTVKEILELLGLSDPWSLLEAEFQALWVPAQARQGLKNVPSAHSELKSILVWRNAVAHSNSGLPIGAQQLIETATYLECLGLAIDEVLQSHTNAAIARLGSAPGAWP